MKERTLQSIRRNYEAKVNEKNDIKSKKEQLQQLEKKSIIKKYLKLKQDVEKYELNNGDYHNSEKNLLLSAYHHYEPWIKKEDTNGIYVYLGTFTVSDEYDIVHPPRDPQVNRNDPKADYSRYRNIENHTITLEVQIESREYFEKNYKIIYPKDFIKNSESWYWELQKDFFKLSIEKGQEAACQEIMQRYE